MRANELRPIRQRVDRIIELADAADEPEAKSNLACFACVLTSAMIEVACREYIGRYVDRRSAPQIRSYVRSQMHYFQNPNAERIDKLLRQFAPCLADAFSRAIGDKGKDAINSVVSNKNDLAHGKGAGLGLDTMKRYLADVLESIASLRDVLRDSPRQR